MLSRGNRDRRSLNLTVGGNELFEGSERTTTEFAAHRVRACDVAVDDPQQTNRFTLILQLLVHTRVIAPKCTHADYGYVDDVIGVQTCVCRRLPIVPSKA